MEVIEPQEQEVVVSEEKSEEPITMKDPKKVDQGKKLAAISKAAKERKMRERIESEIRESQKSKRISYPFLIGSSLVATYVAYRYFFKEKVESLTTEEPRRDSTSRQEVREEKILPKETRRKMFETLD